MLFDVAEVVSSTFAGATSMVNYTSFTILQLGFIMTTVAVSIGFVGAMLFPLIFKTTKKIAKNIWSN